MEYCRKINLRVPEDLKVVGYSNDPRTEIVTPPITSVDQYPVMMGERVVAALMELVTSRQTGTPRYSQEIIPTQLIARESTAGTTKAATKKK
jgi:LacI family transcriptional regulator